MKIIMLGAQGSGKGTQAAKISEAFSIPHISTGDIFRENIKNQTELGKLAQQYTNQGQLVPDDVTNKMVADRIAKDDCKDGFILDGFPRTKEQAQALEGMTPIDHAIDIEISDDEAVKRISGRRSCSACGAVFHTIYNPPKVENRCNVCAEQIIQRDDDKEEVVKKRLEIYHDKTAPLIDFYKEKSILREINGEQPIDKVYADIMDILKGDDL